MKRITLKIILLLILVFMISTIIPRFIIRLTGEFPQRDLIVSDVFFIGVVVSVGLALSLFSFLMNHLIVKRIKALHAATEKVTQGHFDVHVQDHGSDEISRLTAHFNVMTKELKSNEYLNKSFVRNVSHEFKSPIAAIKGYADLLTQEDFTKEEVIDYATIISDTAKRLGTLSYNMLQISKLDSGDIVQSDTTFNLAEQIRKTIQFMQLQWEGKHHELVLALDEIRIESNQELLDQALKNLFENAVKFTPEYGKIEWILKDQTDHVHIELTNHGVGVNSEEAEHIFDLFYSTKEMEHHGFGVGLSIVRKIIDKLNGTITLDSQKGSYFSIRIEIPKKRDA